jgi:hypothetical protein
MSEKFEELRKKDPEVARFVEMAYWSAALNWAGWDEIAKKMGVSDYEICELGTKLRNFVEGEKKDE